MTYSDYIQSDEWRALRDEAIRKADGKCELCGEKAETAHHKQYPRSFKGDKLDNLLAACWACHKKLHGIPDTKYTTDAIFTALSLVAAEEYGVADDEKAVKFGVGLIKYLMDPLTHGGSPSPYTCLADAAVHIAAKVTTDHPGLVLLDIMVEDLAGSVEGFIEKYGAKYAYLKEMLKQVGGEHA